MPEYNVSFLRADGSCGGRIQSDASDPHTAAGQLFNKMNGQKGPGYILTRDNGPSMSVGDFAHVIDTLNHADSTMLRCTAKGWIECVPENTH